MKIIARLTVHCKKTTPRDVLIRFTDEGCGIPEEKLKRIWEPFFTTKEKGTGLGFMVSYEMIKQHMGHIDVKSEIGKGTTIEITLPLMEERK